MVPMTHVVAVGSLLFTNGIYKSRLYSPMVFSLSLDEPGVVWRGFNAKGANEANFAKTARKIALFALFEAFAINVFR